MHKTVLQIQNNIAGGCLKLLPKSVINHIKLSAGDQPYCVPHNGYYEKELP